MSFVLRGQGNPIVVKDVKICREQEADLNNCVSNIPVGAEVLGWYESGTLLSSSLVSPKVTTSYEFRARISGNLQSYFATVTVQEPPSFDIIFAQKVCEGDSIPLVVENKKNIDKIVFLESGGGFYDEGKIFIPQKSTSFEVRASSPENICPQLTKKLLIEYVKLPDISNAKLSTDIIGYATEGCIVSLDALFRQYFSYSGADSINDYTLSFPGISKPDDYQIPRTPGGSLFFTGIVNVVLYKKNDCKTVEKTFSNFSVKFSLIVEAAYPTIYLPGTSLVCRCDSVTLEIQNTNRSRCLFTTTDIRFKPLIGGAPQWISSTVGNNQEYIKYKISPQEDITYQAEIECKMVCPKDTQKHKVSLNLFVKIDTCLPDVTYKYCQGDTAFFQMQSISSNQYIRNFTFDFGQKNYFREVDKDSNSCVYASLDTLMYPGKYSPLNYSFEYYYKSCKKSERINNKVNIELDNCTPYLYQIIYPSIPSAVNFAYMGDTTILVFARRREVVQIDSIIFPSNLNYTAWYFKEELVDSDPQIIFYYYKIVAYNQPNIYRTKLPIKPKIYYRQAGVKDSVEISFELDVRNDMGDLILQYPERSTCAGAPMQAVVMFVNPIIRLYKNSVDSAFAWDFQPDYANVKFDHKEENHEGASYYYFNFDPPPLELMQVSVKMRYWQGDTSSQKEAQRTSFTVPCPPFVSADYAGVCQGDEIIFYVEKQNPYDSILSIHWNALKTSDTFRLQVQSDSIYRVEILAKNGDTIQKYEDSICLNIWAKPQAFTQNSFSICRGSTVDLRHYENISSDPSQYMNPYIKSITYLGDPFYSGYHSVYIPYIAEPYETCVWMEGSSVYMDSVEIRVDSTLWYTVMPDTTVCQNTRLQLRANANGFVTWIKNGKILYQDIPVDSVVYDVVEQASDYHIEFKNACGQSNAVLHIDILPAPELRIEPNVSVCLYDSIDLQVLNFSGIPSTLHWTYNLPGDGEIDTLWGASARMAFSSLDTQKVFVSGLGYNACPSSALCKIKVKDLPKVKLLDPSGDSVLCAIGATTLDLIASGAQSYYFPQFNILGNHLKGLSVDTTSTFIVIGTDAEACSNKGYYYVIYAEQFLKFVDTFFCETYDICLSADSLENSRYAWYDPQGKLLSKEKQMCLYSPDQFFQGQYSLQVDRFFCKDIAKFALIAKPTPSPKIEADSFYCYEQDIFINSQNNMPGSISWWEFPDNTIIKDTAFSLFSISYSDTGRYAYHQILDACANRPLYMDLRIRPIPEINLGDTTYVCQASSLRLDVEREGGNYLWSTGDTTSYIHVFDSAKIWVEVKENGCFNRDTISISLRSTPFVDLGESRSVCNTEELVLSGPKDADSYLWQDGSRNQEMPVSVPGWYICRAEKNACMDTDSVYIRYRFCGKYYLPNAFTPNQDGINDEFKVMMYAEANLVEFHLQIYNRSGELLFETKDMQDAWDGTYKGKPCPSGVYVGSVRIVDKIEGETYSQNFTLNIIY